MKKIEHLIIRGMQLSLPFISRDYLNVVESSYCAYFLNPELENHTTKVLQND